MSKQDINHMEEVIICTGQGTTFPTKISTSMCNALINTGATRSCISEKYYQHLPSTRIHHLKNISIRSATGSNLTPLGVISCSFELGKIRFNSNLIVCRNLTRPLILGRDFLIQNHIMVQNADDGKCILDYQQHELIASIDVEDKHQLNMTHFVTLPGRTLAIICVYNTLVLDQSGYIYEIEPSSHLYEKYPNLCVIPMIHNVDIHKTKNVPLVDSGDIGKTPLLEVEIDTADSLPITQKPYTLPLKHAAWVQRELEILEKAGVIKRSVSPWASPIVVVPKRTAPGEPPK